MRLNSLSKSPRVNVPSQKPKIRLKIDENSDLTHRLMTVQDKKSPFEVRKNHNLSIRLNYNTDSKN